MRLSDVVRLLLIRSSEADTEHSKPETETSGTQFRTVAEPQQLSELFARSEDGPLLIFKHDPFCPISIQAYSELARIGGRIELIDVARHRATSLALAAQTGVKHDSPQVIVLRNRTVVWHASHDAITTSAVQRALERAATV